MFLAPLYMAQELGSTLEYVFPLRHDNQHLKGHYRGVKLSPIKSQSKYEGNVWSEKELFFWLLKNSRKIDVLALYWLSPRNILFANIYKIFNPKGVCYIKADINEKQILELEYSQKKYRTKIKHFLTRAVDIFSVETSYACEMVREGKLGSFLANNVVYCPNGFDVELFKSYNTSIKSWDEKSNLIIMVGRIGSHQKNCEMMLQSLDGIDLKGWKVLFVGPVEQKFETILDNFLLKNPQLADSVRCHGNAESKKELWDIYNSAKVFVLTSLYEGFPNVFSEALFFNNFIITTDVSSAADITNGGTIGSIVQINNIEHLKKQILDFVDNPIKRKADIERIAKQGERFTWSNCISGVVEKILKKRNEKVN